MVANVGQKLRLPGLVSVSNRRPARSRLHAHRLVVIGQLPFFQVLLLLALARRTSRPGRGLRRRRGRALLGGRLRVARSNTPPGRVADAVHTVFAVVIVTAVGAGVVRRGAVATVPPTSVAIVLVVAA